MKAVLVLLDSLNRHYLSTYGSDRAQTPNLDRLARRSVVFDNHYLGSAPCMPARRDMMTGRLHFLERGWGGLEPFDTNLPEMLDKAGVHSHMETDHYHYLLGGGEFYYSLFRSWQCHRGQENDNMPGPIAAIDEPEHLGKWTEQYDRNRTQFKTEADFPSPKTFAGAVDWLQANENADNYFLWVEAFDPHEPFDCPDGYLEMYNDDWTGPRYDWSGYERVEEESDASRHLQKQYAACLTMTDRWLGKLLDEIERQNGFEDTLIVLTTDHGHLLGERGLTGKNRWHCWNELAHIPLFMHLPGGQCAAERRDGLTQNIDLFPTLCEYFGIPVEHEIHGQSLLPIAKGELTKGRDTALYGWFGSTVNVTDGRCTYLRAPASPDNTPLYRHFLMPTRFHGRFTPREFENAELGKFLPYTDTPVLRAPVKRGGHDPETRETKLFDLETDPGQTRNLAGRDLEPQFVEMLINAMKAISAPPSQYERLGL